MKSQENFFIKKIIVSIIIWLWGIFIIKSYNIDIMQTFIEKINGYQQAISFAYGTDNFLKALRTDNTFNTFILHTEKELEVHLFLAMSVTIQNFNAKIYDLYFHYNVRDISDTQDKICSIVFIITNFFLVFVSNNMLVVIFRTLTYNSKFVKNMVSNIIYISEKVLNSPVLYLISFPFIIIIMFALWFQLLLPFLEMLVVVLACWMMLYFKINIPCFVIILFTICIRSVFILIKFYYSTSS